jgi:hypothetical protein
MTQATIQITNKLPTDTGFAIRVDDSSFAQTFVPSHIMRGAGLEVGCEYNVMLADNDAQLAAATPWRVSQMISTDQPEAEVAATPAPVEAPAPTARSIDDKIVGELAEYDFLSTGEIASCLGVEVGVARDRLLALFNAGKIVTASVYGRPNLKRASFALWAMSVDSFGGLGEE